MNAVFYDNVMVAKVLLNQFRISLKLSKTSSVHVEKIVSKV